MYSQLIQPTTTASPGMHCSSTQMQLLFYQFLLHVQPNVDSKCIQSLQELLQFRKDESTQHPLEKCQQEVNNLTSTHFRYLISVHKSWERLETGHALEISKYVDNIESLKKELEEYKMELENLKINTEKNCSKKVEAPEENVTVKQNMYAQLLQPTTTASPGMLCSSTQMQLLLYQFLLHVQPNVDNRCIQSLQDLLQFRKDESTQHQLEKCQQEINNLTSMHFSHLISVYNSWERIESDHALEISNYVDRIESLNKELEEYKMELQELKRNTEKNCSKEVAAPEESVTEKQVSSEVLCEKGATVEKLNEGLVNATSVGNSSLVNNYLECGADPNSAVHLASHYGVSEIVQLLLDRGADMDLERKNDKWTPLHVAVQYGHVGVVRLLLSKGAETDARRSDECTPLYQASSLGKAQIVQMLLEYNASLELKCENDFTPLHVAVKKNHLNVTSVLLERGAHVNDRDGNNQTALLVAAWNYRLEMVKLLIQHNANVNQRDKDGWAALHVVAGYKDTQVPKALLEAGADVNILGGPNLQTALYTAAVYNNSETVKLLIQHNANVDLPDKLGYTALHYASDGNFIGIVEALLEAGGDVNIHPANGLTALHLAALKGHLEMVKLLVSKGANAKQYIKPGNSTPRDYAMTSGHKQVAEYLASVGG